MISDGELYSLAVFLGSTAMVLIVLYHFLEVNAPDAASEKTALGQKGGAEKQAS
jgi:oligosaccharyl transferase complex subunit OST4